ncbi:Uncharacterised protein [Mycobacteroides abscessus subsp. bolletii]|nr:Uncharacterised protein [Mycobacteroides abscessus subsp. bolletii]SKQ60659.1 Uncharacterised protein [Mycobacteroides abscessus subsp. bolletii]
MTGEHRPAPCRFPVLYALPRSKFPDMNIWRVTPTEEPDTYEFTYMPSVGALGEVRFEQPGSEPIPAEQSPIGIHESFIQRLDPGTYSLGWHWMQGQPEVRASVELTLPFAEPHLLLAVD